MKNLAVFGKRQAAGMAMLILMIGLSACNSRNEAIELETNRTETTAGLQQVSLTRSQFNSSGMKLGRISDRAFPQVIKANGMLDVPPENRASVSAYFGGYVKEIQLLPGQQVQKGQILFTLENPEYVQIQQDFLETGGRLNYLKSEYERQQELVKDNVTSQKNYLKAESDYKVSLARYQALKKKLELMNIDPQSLTGENLQTSIMVKAPISGYITEVKAEKGMFLNPADVAVNITNRDHLHLELNIFEGDLPMLKVGQPISFQLQNGSGHTYEAKVHLISNYLDPETRTARVHGHFMNEEDARAMVPGMYVEAQILTTSRMRAALPEEAAVGVEKNYYVLVKKPGTGDTLNFEKRQLHIGRLADGYVEVINHADFSPEDDFLVNGAFNLIKG